MNRRGFMKVLLGCSAAAALPVVGKAVSSKPVIAFDPAKPGADRTEMMIGRYEGVRFIESARFVETKVYLESTPEGGSFFYDEQQKIKFKSHRDRLLKAMNKIASDRVDNMALAQPLRGRVFSEEHASLSPIRRAAREIDQRKESFENRLTSFVEKSQKKIEEAKAGFFYIDKPSGEIKFKSHSDNIQERISNAKNELYALRA